MVMDIMKRLGIFKADHAKTHSDLIDNLTMDSFYHVALEYAGPGYELNDDEAVIAFLVNYVRNNPGSANEIYTKLVSYALEGDDPNSLASSKTPDSLDKFSYPQDHDHVYDFF